MPDTLAALGPGVLAATRPAKVPPSIRSFLQDSFRHLKQVWNGRSSRMTARQKLSALWFSLGLLPLALQVRSYAKFAKPHTIPEILVVQPDLPKQTANLSSVCPVEALQLVGLWWNFEPTHYYTTENGIICHSVVPQYNTHGNYFIGNAKVPPYRSTPSGCSNDSFPFEVYFYHGSIGFYSFYEGEVGTYCTKDKVANISVEVLGTYDTNGAFLVEDTGSTKTRMSYWYCLLCALWLAYRALILRRSFISCMRYGRRCDDMGEGLHHHDAIVFVQESLRLSAHGAVNTQRVLLVYLLVEGIMTDLFLIIANDGWLNNVQYASLGYNMSGLMLLLFEMLESSKLVKEKWRLRIKRIFFSYEIAVVGELVIAIVFQRFISSLNQSDFRRSKPAALAVSYYFWSLICHCVVVLDVVLIIASVRIVWALTFVWLKHRSFAVLSEPCCVDAVLGVRSRTILLGDYQRANGKLYYKPSALKAFGILKSVEEGVEYLALHELHWLSVPRENLVVVGIIRGDRVEPCKERRCAGILSFVDRRLGGDSSEVGPQAPVQHVRGSQVVAWSGPGDGTPSTPFEKA